MCKCEKDLGCYSIGETISLELPAPCDGDYEFEIHTLGTVVKETQTLTTGDNLEIVNSFNENAVGIIKVKTPCGTAGLTYITSDRGACGFKFTSLIPQCG